MEWINVELLQDWASTVFVLCFVWFILSKLFQPKTPQPQDIQSESQITTCTNQNCIRCSNYQQVLVKANERFTKVIQKDQLHLLSRIEKSLAKSHPDFTSDQQKPNVFFLTDLDTQPVWGSFKVSSYQKDLIDVESQFEDIIEEYADIKDLMEQDNGGWSWNVTGQGSWATFYLFNQGIKVLENCHRCPATVACVESLQNIMRHNVFANVYFSVIGCDSEIAEHFGPTNIRLRAHLGLQIPPDCHMFVADVRLTWEEGKCLVFDDSFIHKVIANGDKPRVTLIFDLWHPNLSTMERQVLADLFETGDA